MAFTIPAIADIGTRIRSAFRAYLPGTDAWIEPNNLSVSGKAFSLGLFEVYQRVAYLYRQLFASTADGDHLELRHAAEYGLTRKPSTGASGNVIVPQAAGDDGQLPAGLQLVRDDGTFYQVATATTALAGSFTLPVACTATGADTNTPAGSVVSIVPQSGVNLAASSGTVDGGGLGGGADAETDSALRARVLQRKQFTPMCGRDADYVRWATEVAGCTRAFASGFANQPPGVVVYPLFDATRPNGVPVAADLAAVSAYVETQRPVTARAFYVAANPQPLNVTVSYQDGDTTANRAAIVAGLVQLLADKSAVATVDAPLTFRLGWIEAAVDRALGGQGFTVAAPTTDLIVATGNLLTPGTITWPDGSAVPIVDPAD